VAKRVMKENLVDPIIENLEIKITSSRHTIDDPFENV